eukprot:4143847-Alexandrium_andersonii.AAC.1
MNAATAWAQNLQTAQPPSEAAWGEGEGEGAPGRRRRLAATGRTPARVRWARRRSGSTTTS